MDNESTHEYQSLLTVLHECMVACNTCYQACLQEDDVQKMTECIRLDRECADFCSYFEQAISRGTAYVSELATTCITICKDCGNECKQHNHDHCQKCAEACLKCAEECQKLLA
ncbi:four-helix bundle copper-binding protein [Lederbergia galactosidilytica]|uniref:Ferredoxin n=1 Tax=Lederbergia galactosidilytica TaxID=217031 RepID=A0A177ZWF0_9BACI|nr:four-helix bundle copper-binding protein [Lederbergia galactosidilytica]KRG12429.1 ferredoxin [Virgibacillus soli]OAK72231.1 ferredoxin [Lederbergia galactosidilytica]